MPRCSSGSAGEVLDGQGQLERVGDDLAGDAVVVGEGGAEDLVAADDLGEGAAERVDVEPAVEPDGGGDVVGGLPGSSRSRNQRRCWAKEAGSGPARSTRSIGGAWGRRGSAQGLLDQGGQVGEGRRLEEVLERDLDPEDLSRRGP